MNVGAATRAAEHGLLSTVAWVLRLRNAAPRPRYALEGSVFMAGGAVQWLRDALGIVERPAEIGPLAAQAADNGDVYFVPALTGLGAPYWDPNARGLLIGLTRGTAARASGPSHRGGHLLPDPRRCSRRCAGPRASRSPGLRVDGGAAGDDFLLQLQADLLGVPVTRPQVRETTALGAAALAGLAVGFWSPRTRRLWPGPTGSSTPRMAADERLSLYDEWERAVERARAGRQ